MENLPSIPWDVDIVVAYKANNEIVLVGESNDAVWFFYWDGSSDAFRFIDSYMKFKPVRSICG